MAHLTINFRSKALGMPVMLDVLMPQGKGGKSGYYDGIELKVESEYGTWLVIDGLPKAYQVYAETLNTATNRSVAWAS